MDTTPAMHASNDPTSPPRPESVLPDPRNPAAVRTWLASNAPDLVAVRAWARRLLGAPSAPCSVPALGTPAWVALADHDPRKLAATIAPALAQLADRTPAACAVRLRAGLDEFATAWRRAHAEAGTAIADYRATHGHRVGPSHAELERRRATYPCSRCTGAVPNQATDCPHCDWTEPTPDQRRAHAAASWALTDTRAGTGADGRTAA